jgi:phage terminase small subunit
MGYIASMSQFEKANKYSPMPKDKYGLQELTQMQRAFCEYLVMNEGRCTNKDAALHAGYSPKRAAVEASELMKLSHVQAYLTRRMNEVNKAFVVNRQNFVKRQINLSTKLEKEGKTEKTAAFESMIGKAMGIFIDRKEIITRDLTAEDKLRRKEELRKKAEKMRRVNDLIKE